MSYAVQKDSSRRLTGLVAVVAFHVVLVYALVHGLARKIVEVVRAPLETKIIEEIKPPPPDKPPPPPPPKLAIPPPPYIPPPEVQVQVPTVSAPTITAVTTVKPPEEYRTPAVIDGCSDLLVELFGEAGRHTRAAVGMAELPFDIAVEIELVARIR